MGLGMSKCANSGKAIWCRKFTRSY
jgi:hypothetical protein